MGRPAPGQLERSLAAMTIGVHQGQAHRRRALLDTKTGEYFQILQTPLSGSAVDTWEFTDVEVQWEMPFLHAASQRRVPFVTPHLHGAEFEVTSGTALFIDFRAQIVGWDVTDEGWYTGGTVRFAVMAPTLTDPLDYTAIAHLTFGGWAAMSEVGEFDT